MLTNRKDIEKWLIENEITNFTIREDLTVDVEGDVKLHHKGLEYPPFQFNQVSGHFWINNNELMSLQGCPQFVVGNFYCSKNRLMNLKGGPVIVLGGYYCYHNLLKTLEGAPVSIGGTFDCSDNCLVSLIGIPNYIRDEFRCDDNLIIKNKCAYLAYCSLVY